MAHEYGLPLVAASLAATFFAYMYLAGKRLDRMGAEFQQAEIDRAEEARKGAARQPDLGPKIAAASKVAAYAASSATKTSVRGRAVAVRRGQKHPYKMRA